MYSAALKHSQSNLHNYFGEIGNTFATSETCPRYFPTFTEQISLLTFWTSSPLNFLAFAGNQEGETISRGSGTNFLPPCVKHTLAHLLASLVFALLVLLLGGGITFAAAGERCCCFAAEAEAAVGVGGRK